MVAQELPAAVPEATISQTPSGGCGGSWTAAPARTCVSCCAWRACIDAWSGAMLAHSTTTGWRRVGNESDEGRAVDAAAPGGRGEHVNAPALRHHGVLSCRDKGSPRRKPTPTDYYASEQTAALGTGGLR